MLKTIFFFGTNERLPIGEEQDKEFIIQVNPPGNKPYCQSAFFTKGTGFWKYINKGKLIPIEDVVAWALMPEPSHNF